MNPPCLLLRAITGVSEVVTGNVQRKDLVVLFDRYLIWTVVSEQKDGVSFATANLYHVQQAIVRPIGMERTLGSYLIAGRQ